MKPHLFYYVHAHGSGHIASFLLVYPELSKYFTVVAITTNQKATTALDSIDDLAVHELPLKWSPNDVPPAHTFSKAFEETPYSTYPIERVATFLALVQDYVPVAFICDGSPELAIVARGMGVRVVITHLLGDTLKDPTQVFAYELADHILAFSPQVLQPEYSYGSKTFFSGYMSQYDQSTIQNNTYDDTISILLGNDNFEESQLQIMTSDLHRKFVIIGNRQAYDLGSHCIQLGRVTNVAEHIAGQIVVTAAGQNSIAELLSLRKKLIVLPEQRPYNEQAANADALAQYGAALRANHAMTQQQWSDLYQIAESFKPRYHHLSNPHAAQEIAAKLQEWYGTV
jgi:UDP-N-acetylglucosamine:LPS N-acetylglucosamine transferase